MLTPADHNDIASAATLIHAVLDRHDTDLTLHALSAMNRALQELRLAERYMEVK